MSYRIMVIEDDLSQRMQLVKSLGRHGFNVGAVGSGEQAVNEFISGVFHCILVDYTLPGINGIETIRRLRGLDPKVGFVVLTGHDPEKVEREIEGLDVWAVCRKPASAEVLIAKIENASELAAMSPEREEQIFHAFEQETTALRECCREAPKTGTKFPPPKLNGK
jgi:DNA-binding response OmpR family regulator